MFSDEEIRLTYGKTTVISRKGEFVLVHLDRPSAELLRSRTEEFDADEFFSKGCALCQMAREGGVVVFDDTTIEDDDVLVD